MKTEPAKYVSESVRGIWRFSLVLLLLIPFVLPASGSALESIISQDYYWETSCQFAGPDCQNAFPSQQSYDGNITVATFDPDWSNIPPVIISATLEFTYTSSYAFSPPIVNIGTVVGGAEIGHAWVTEGLNSVQLDPQILRNTNKFYVVGAGYRTGGTLTPYSPGQNYKLTISYDPNATPAPTPTPLPTGYSDVYWETSCQWAGPDCQTAFPSQESYDGNITVATFDPDWSNIPEEIISATLEFVYKTKYNFSTPIVNIGTVVGGAEIGHAWVTDGLNVVQLDSKILRKTSEFYIVGANYRTGGSLIPYSPGQNYKIMLHYDPNYVPIPTPTPTPLPSGVREFYWETSCQWAGPDCQTAFPSQESYDGNVTVATLSADWTGVPSTIDSAMLEFTYKAKYAYSTPVVSVGTTPTGTDLGSYYVNEGLNTIQLPAQVLRSASQIYIMAGGYRTGGSLIPYSPGQNYKITIFHPSNTPPTVDAGGPYQVNEGNSVQLIATGSDPENGPLAYAWDLDNNGSFETPGQSVLFSAINLDGPSSRTIAVQVTDNGNLSATDQATVNIQNSAPTVDVPVVTPEPSMKGSAVAASATFNDPDPNDSPFTCTVDYGDGSGALTGMVSGSTCTGPSHTYMNVGSFTAILSVTDKDNGTGSNSTTHAVIYNFNGFFQPVDNPPTFNVVKAGRGIAVKFSLSGDQGLNIFPAGYPKSQGVSCDTAASLDDIEETITVGASSLSYDPVSNQYGYNWKTNTAWAGTCRQLIVKLLDGTEHLVYFKFK